MEERTGRAGGVPAQATGASGIRDANVTLTDGTQIHILEAGQPTSAPAVVFIPGWTLPAFLWTNQMRSFSTDRLAIAIDPRSEGDSSKTEMGNTPEQRARDLREILSKLRITSAVLVGWSQGDSRHSAGRTCGPWMIDERLVC